MKTPYEGSYFLLLGQVTLMLSAFLFGLSRAALATGSQLGEIDELSQFYLLFIAVACLILAIAIFIGWTSTSTLLRKLKAAGKEDEITNKLFTFDVVGIACLFMAANVLLFSIVATYHTSPSAFQLPESFAVKANDVGAVTSAFYLLNAVFLGTCKPWNSEYFRLTGEASPKGYDLQLYSVVGIQLFCAVSTVVFRAHAAAEFSLFVIWACSWSVINFSWIKSQLLGL